MNENDKNNIPQINASVSVLSASTLLRYRDRILNGPILKTMTWLAWPIVIANLVNISYNLIDTFWLGKLGKESLSAPVVCWPLIMLFYSIGMGFSSAGISLISQYVGAGESELANKSASHLYGFMAMLAAGLSLLGYLTTPTILALIGVPPDVLPLAVEYIKVIFMGIPIAFVGFAFIAILNSLGDTRTPTILGIISSLANLVLDPILIFGYFGLPALGVVGAAVATVISRALLSVIGIVLLAKRWMGIRIIVRELIPQKWWLSKVFRIGAPLALQQSANALGFTIMTGIVSKFGSVVISAYGVGIRIIDLLQAFSMGFMNATAIMVGQNIGAEYYDRAKKIAIRSLTLMATLMAIGTLLIYLFRTHLIAAFINDPRVIEEGVRFLMIFLPSIPFFGMFFISGGIARGSGHTKAFTIISLIRLWALRIGLSYLLAIALNYGPTGIWAAMSVSNIAAGIMATAWVSRGTWLRRVIEVPTSLGATHHR